MDPQKEMENPNSATINLAWMQMPNGNLDVTIDTGATNLTVLLPSDVGVRVKVDRGPTVIDASGLVEDGDVYTNDAYGVSDVTLKVDIDAGVGQINLEVEE